MQRRTPDELVYTRQAGIITQQGTEGIRRLIREYNADEKQWIYPPPTRVGYLWTLAVFMKMVSKNTLEVGAYLSCFFSIISLILLVVLGLRFFNRWITLYALLFMNVSPVALAIARRTWQDAMLGAVGLSLIWLSCEIIRATNKIKWIIVFILIGSYATLIKESGMLIYGLCAAWLLFTFLINEKSFKKAILLMTLGGLGIVISVVYLSHAAGGFSNILEVWQHVKEAMPTNRYAIEYQSGPWYQFVGSAWIVSPVNTILFLIGMLGTFFSRSSDSRSPASAIDKNRNIIFGIIIFIITFMSITVLTPYCQNVRYVSVLFAPFYLVGGVGLWHIMTYIRSKLDNFYFSIVVACVVVSLIISAAMDYQNFIKIFVKKSAIDTSIRTLRECSN
ncbi:MAG: glycosyltransferase family 39 protein [Candidatus Omnitrophica bacterium]|nr:glycosyltransferase family 39 protein [Candidatus Omnitrophota bacterium]